MSEKNQPKKGKALEGNKPKAGVPKPRERKTFSIVTVSAMKVVGFLDGKQYNFLPLNRYTFPEERRADILKQFASLLTNNQIKIE